MRGWKALRGADLIRPGTWPWSALGTAMVCLLAALTLIGAGAADRGASGAAAELGLTVTVVVRPRVDETGPAAAARAAEALAQVDGVAEARSLPQAEAEALLRRWTDAPLPPGLPLPMLVEARLEPAAPASAVSLGRALADAGLDARVDAPDAWQGPLRRGALILRAVALALGAVALIAAAAAGAAGAGAALTRARAELEALARLGAEPAWLKRAAVLAVGRPALAASAAGAGAGALAAAAWGLAGGPGGELIAPPALLLGLAPILAAVGGAAAAAVRLTREVLGGGATHG